MRALVMSLLLWAAPLSPVRTAEPRLPSFAGDSLPVPPSQDEAWEPAPGSVPGKWIDAAHTLFTQGLADPRGGEYREIQVVVGNVWGTGQLVTTHGWVLPRHASAGQDFAVCWNGLVYPVIKVGAPGDFRTDALSPANDSFLGSMFESSERLTLQGAMAPNSKARNFPLKACLLFRLGEGALARTAVLQHMQAQMDHWAQLTEQRARKAGREPPARKIAEIDPEADPYLEWAGQWAWSLWDRAVCAHMRVDDRLALVSLRQLARQQAAIETEAKKRGFKPSHRHEPDREQELAPYLSWLEEPLPRLLADQERRATAPRRPTVLEAGLEQYPDRGTRLAALIEDLQEVAVRQHDQPGGLDPYADDPVVKALVGMGEEAIDPLLHAWETDAQRLTRSVSFVRDFDSGRSLHGVAEPIVATLAELIHVTIDDFRVLPGGIKSAAVREYWRKGKAMAPEERRFQTLSDDGAGVKAWLQAATEIVRPAHEQNLGNGWTAFGNPPPDEDRRLSGEALRARTNPSVSEIWRKRVPQVIKSAMAIPASSYALQEACEFVLQFAEWDETAALPSIRETMLTCIKHTRQQPSASIYFRRYLSRSALLLDRHGDRHALEEYCAWLAQAKTGRSGEPFEAIQSGFDLRDNLQLFEPLWNHPEAPAVKAVVAKIFGGPNPPGAPLLADRFGRDGPLTNTIKTPLLRFPEVRSSVGAALENRAVMGEVEVNARGRRRFDGAHADGAPPPAGAVLDTVGKYRVRDYYSWQLSRWKGMPEMELTWPEEQREAACVKAARLLRDGDGLFQEQKPRALPGDWPPPDQVSTYP